MPRSLSFSRSRSRPSTSNGAFGGAFDNPENRGCQGMQGFGATPTQEPKKATRSFSFGRRSSSSNPGSGIGGAGGISGPPGGYGSQGGGGSQGFGSTGGCGNPAYASQGCGASATASKPRPTRSLSFSRKTKRKADTPEGEFPRAARAGDLNKMRQILSTSPGSINEADVDGYSGLHLSCEMGHFECARFLVERGAAINMVARSDQNTPLHTACLAGRTNCAKMLIDFSAALEARNDKGRTPLQMALGGTKSAPGARVELVQMLLAASAEADTKCNQGITPLMVSVHTGQVEAAQLLLAARANVDALDNDGATALIRAAGCGQLECVALLLEAGCDTTPTLREHNALDFARERGHVDVVELIAQVTAPEEPPPAAPAPPPDLLGVSAPQPQPQPSLADAGPSLIDLSQPAAPSYQQPPPGYGAPVQQPPQPAPQPNFGFSDEADFFNSAPFAPPPAGVLSPLPLDGADFFRRWGSLAAHEKQQTFSMAATPNFGQTAHQVLAGLGLAVLPGLDPNPNNFVAAGAMHGGDPTGVLVRLEVRIDVGMARASLRSTAAAEMLTSKLVGGLTPPPAAAASSLF